MSNVIFIVKIVASKQRERFLLLRRVVVSSRDVAATRCRRPSRRPGGVQVVGDERDAGWFFRVGGGREEMRTHHGD